MGLMGGIMDEKSGNYINDMNKQIDQPGNGKDKDAIDEVCRIEEEKPDMHPSGRRESPIQLHPCVNVTQSTEPNLNDSSHVPSPPLSPQLDVQPPSLRLRLHLREPDSASSTASNSTLSCASPVSAASSNSYSHAFSSLSFSSIPTSTRWSDMPTPSPLSSTTPGSRGRSSSKGVGVEPNSRSMTRRPIRIHRRADSHPFAECLSEYSLADSTVERGDVSSAEPISISAPTLASQSDGTKIEPLPSLPSSPSSFASDSSSTTTSTSTISSTSTFNSPSPPVELPRSPVVESVSSPRPSFAEAFVHVATPPIGSRIQRLGMDFEWTKDHLRISHLMTLRERGDPVVDSLLEKLKPGFSADVLTIMAERAARYMMMQEWKEDQRNPASPIDSTTSSTSPCASTSATSPTHARPRSFSFPMAPSAFDSLDPDEVTLDLECLNFLRFYSNPPDWVDWESVARGQIVFQRFSICALPALFFSSLVGGLGAPLINQVLTSTGYLMGSCPATYRRLVETAQMVIQAMGPDVQSLRSPWKEKNEDEEEEEGEGGKDHSMGKGQGEDDHAKLSGFIPSPSAADSHSPPLPPSHYGDGWLACLRVRFLHGKVRAMLLNRSPPHDWDTATYGIPINQEDMLVTLLAFSYNMVHAIANCGINLTQQEKEDYLHCWRYLGWLHGVSDDLLSAHMTSYDACKRAFESICYHLVHPDHTSFKLSQHIIYSVQQCFPTRWGYSFHIGLARQLMGGEWADELKLPTCSTWQRVKVGMLFAGIRLWCTMMYCIQFMASINYRLTIQLLAAPFSSPTSGGRAASMASYAKKVARDHVNKQKMQQMSPASIHHARRYSQPPPFSPYSTSTSPPSSTCTGAVPSTPIQSSLSTNPSRSRLSFMQRHAITCVAPKISTPLPALYITQHPDQQRQVQRHNAPAVEERHNIHANANRAINTDSNVYGDINTVKTNIFSLALSILVAIMAQYLAPNNCSSGNDSDSSSSHCGTSSISISSMMHQQVSRHRRLIFSILVFFSLLGWKYLM